MNEISDFNVKLCKKIYNYITPIIVMEEKWIKQENPMEVFELIENMRNTACHHIINKGTIINGEYIQSLFINMVKLYRVFGLDLLDKFKQIRRLWDQLECDHKFKLCRSKGPYINCSEILKVKDVKEFNDYFKGLLNFIHKSGNNPELFKLYEKASKTDIKLIYKYAAPIILWYHNVQLEFKNDHPDDLLLKISYYTRTFTCHFSEMVVNKNTLKELIENICIVYLAFGIDLYENRTHVKDLILNKPTKCRFVNDVKKEIQLDDKTESMPSNTVIETIRDILSDKDHPLNDEYLLFGKFLHYFVSTKISKGDMITQVFRKNNINIEWCDIENRFIINDMKNNPNKKSIIKLASPLFVWIEIVNNLRNFDRNQQFYLSINAVRIEIINYLITNENMAEKEKYILQEMKLFYEPIESNNLNLQNLRNIPYYKLFKKLVNHSVIGRKQYKFSYSFIFNYYFCQGNVGNENKNKAKMFDIFNFCGVFYIFVKYVENKWRDSNDDFYKKVKEITDEITQYIKDKDNNLVDKIIDDMKSVFPDCPGFLSSNDEKIKEIFSTIYEYIVKSRANVEISFINSKEEVEEEVENSLSNLFIENN